MSRIVFNIDQDGKCVGRRFVDSDYILTGNDQLHEGNTDQLPPLKDLHTVEYKQNTDYIELRRNAYPSIGDQLDYIYHNGIEAWKLDIIKPIKDQYPKPI